MNVFRALPFVAALALAGCGPEAPVAYQGYVEGEFVRVASPIAGTLVSLAVERGSGVKSGDPLFTLEQESEQAARREAEERVRAARARLDNLEKAKRPEELAAIEAQYREAQAALDAPAAVDHARARRRRSSQDRLPDAAEGVPARSARRPGERDDEGPRRPRDPQPALPAEGHQAGRAAAGDDLRPRRAGPPDAARLSLHVGLPHDVRDEPVAQPPRATSSSR